MCSNPSTNPEGNTFACRTCDECVGDRLNQWTARAVAEAAFSPYTMSITLTYGAETEAQRDGAAMFRYSDIQLFMANLRRQIAYHLKRAGAVRFIACGEQGDRFGRCHWHIVLYSEVDLLTIGKWFFKDKQVGRDDIITHHGEQKKRRTWTMWPHGFVVVQEPDEGGIRYALSYALKDQFSVKKSLGSKRHARAEEFPTGFFRPSKRPPIGRVFLDHVLGQLEASGSVLTRLVLRVPNYSWPWYVHGSERRYLLTRLCEINDAIRETTGRDAPQWPALLKSLENSPADMEIINGTTTEENPDDPDHTSIGASLKLRERETQQRYADTQTARSCGRALPCKLCLRTLAPEDRDALGVDVSFGEDGSEIWTYRHGDFAKESARPLGKLNPYCQLRDTPAIKRVFPHSSKKPSACS